MKVREDLQRAAENIANISTYIEVTICLTTCCGSICFYYLQFSSQLPAYSAGTATNWPSTYTWLQLHGDTALSACSCSYV